MIVSGVLKVEEMLGSKFISKVSRYIIEEYYKPDISCEQGLFVLLIFLVPSTLTIGFIVSGFGSLIYSLPFIFSAIPVTISISFFLYLYNNFERDLKSFIMRINIRELLGKENNMIEIRAIEYLFNPCIKMTNEKKMCFNTNDLITYKNRPQPKYPVFKVIGLCICEKEIYLRLNLIRCDKRRKFIYSANTSNRNLKDFRKLTKEEYVEIRNELILEKL